MKVPFNAVFDNYAARGGLANARHDYSPGVVAVRHLSLGDNLATRRVHPEDGFPGSSTLQRASALCCDCGEGEGVLGGGGLFQAHV